MSTVSMIFNPAEDYSQFKATVFQLIRTHQDKGAKQVYKIIREHFGDNFDEEWFKQSVKELLEVSE